eukprot:TRINITY_DN308_c0_g1_i1.p1 TRINITY_DN308_c0_g1~~TRINITY_DN308_c0_g1_i1.p1  ORF type:complete len:257 (+),score=68.81 TRINITY_DN308_c0_g1_i1:32-802(+)
MEAETGVAGGEEEVKMEIDPANLDLEPETETKEVAKETVTFEVSFKKEKFSITWPLDDSVLTLKKHIESLSGVPVELQKLTFKGMVKNDTQSIRELGVKPGSKMMLIGSTMKDVIEVNMAPDPAKLAAAEAEKKKEEPLSDQTKHKKIIDKGVPENAGPGLKGRNEPLPKTPLQGILNTRGTSVRLTFKFGELCINSKSNTDRIPYTSVKSVNTEPIKGHEEYHIMTLNLSAGKYFLYWIPAQYTKAVQNNIMGFL